MEQRHLGVSWVDIITDVAIGDVGYHELAAWFEEPLVSAPQDLAHGTALYLAQRPSVIGV